MLLAGAAVVFGGVLTLAALTVDEEPSFSERLQTGSTTRPPQALGAVLEVSGDRPGRFVLEHGGATSNGSFGMESDDGRIIITQDDSGDPFIDQMSWDGLDFFLDPGDCTFTVGDVNEEMGLARSEISCVDIRDVRDTATITVEGTAGLPVRLVSSDLPPMGGTVLVSGDLEETWEFDGGTWAAEPPDFADWSATLYGSDATINMQGTDDLTVTGIYYREVAHDVPADACDVTADQVAVVGPGTSLVETSFTCEQIDLGDVGTVTLEGSVVVERAGDPGRP